MLEVTDGRYLMFLKKGFDDFDLNAIFLLVNIIMFHVDINILHVNISILHIETFNKKITITSTRGQKYAIFNLPRKTVIKR